MESYQIKVLIFLPYQLYLEKNKHLFSFFSFASSSCSILQLTLYMSWSRVALQPFVACWDVLDRNLVFSLTQCTGTGQHFRYFITSQHGWNQWLTGLTVDASHHIKVSISAAKSTVEPGSERAELSTALGNARKSDKCWNHFKGANSALSPF